MQRHKFYLLLIGTASAMYGQFSSPVRIVNTTSQAVPAVDPTAPGRQAFAASVTLTPSYTAGTNLFGASGSFNIPAGMRLAIEHVAVTPFYLSQGATTTMTVAGNLLNHGSGMPTTSVIPFTTAADGIFNRTQFTSSIPLKLYLEGGSANISWSGLAVGTLPGNITVYISGYLVDCSVSGSCNN